MRSVLHTAPCLPKLYCVQGNHFSAKESRKTTVCVCCLVVDLIQMTFPSQRCDFFMFPLPQKLKARARGLSPDIRQIDLDVNRTYRDHIMFMHRYDVKYETPILPKNLWDFFSKMVTFFWFYYYVDCFVFVCFSGSRLFFMSSLPTLSTTQ